MTTRQEDRAEQQTRGRARRVRTAAHVALLAAALTVTGTPSPASAAVPRVAQQWTSLMRQSLTPSAEYVQLRKTLAGQRATVASRMAGVARSRSAHAAAQTALTTAVTEDATVRTRYALAREALASARNTLVAVSQRRPVNGAAVSRCKSAVTARATTAATRRAEARQGAAKLVTAQAGARTATAGVDKAITAWQNAGAVVRTNQLKLNDLDRSAELAGRAAKLSRAVVTEIRPGFLVADTTTVNGITVHKSVAFAFRRMITDARADGIVLSGGGFRTQARQIELRKSNGCKDIWTAPASSCRVPTAIPGRSLHEIGLAVDLTTGGRSLTAGSAAFRWLATNADEYGYVNLPSEPWHWSITGG
jgi:D-alanyl-D-alanine carboxypeptidase